MLRILNLEAGYGPLRVLKGISLHVSPGEAVAIIGANGAGKTTLLKTIAGILKPRSGEIAFDKQNIHGRPAEKIVGLGCCLVPEGRHVFSTMTVRENLLLGAYLPASRRAGSASIAARAWSRSTASSASSRSGRTSSPARSPAASSRCWPSAGP